MFYGLLQGSALPATREHCGGGKMPGGMRACRPTVCALCGGGNGAGIGPYGYHAVLCRAGCPHPAVKAAASPTGSP